MPERYDQVIAFVLGFAFADFICWFMGKLKQWRQTHVGSKDAALAVTPDKPRGGRLS